MKCKLCYGFGLWAWGTPSPIGPMDARDGIPTVACPVCNSNANPIKEVQRGITPEKGRSKRSKGGR